jgi:hypothetical protein
MDEILAQLFPQAPSYFPGLLGQEQATQLQQQARQQGLLGLGMGLLQAAAPSTSRTGLGAGIAQGLSAGQQMAQNVYAQKLQEQMIGQKLLEQQRAMREQEVARSLLPQILTPGQQTPTMYGQPSVFPQRDEEGNILPGAGVQTGQPQINFNTLQALLTQAPGAAAQVLPIVKTFQELTKPEEFKLGPEETMFRRTPTGVQTVAVGGGKPEKPAGAVLEAMQVLGIDLPINQLSPEQREQIGTYIDRKEALKSPKVSVDLKDPTAVAKAQQSVLGDWRGILKDTGATEVASRYAAAVNAVQQGNAGNKAADGALIYAVGKIYDPSGAVQEGDKNTILGNRSIPEQIKALAQKTFQGGSLLPSERQGLLDVVTEQVKARERSVNEQRIPYASLSQSLGGDGTLLQNPLTQVLKDAEKQIQSARTIQGTNITLDAVQAEIDRRNRERKK